MTAAQKTAKLKFKQAIAYRQKTGVTLKEAFAHIYGKKVGVVKKKAAPKKKVAKKVVRKVVKKVAKKKIGYSKVRLEQEKGITKVLKNTPKTLFPYTAKEKIVKAGKKYFDEQAKKISGTNIEDKMFKNLYNVREKIANTKQAILKYQSFAKLSPNQKYLFTNKAKQYKKYLVELMTHYKELKKLI